MQRFYASNGAYNQLVGATTALTNPLDSTLARVPREQNTTQTYAISLAATAPNAFTLQAVPMGAMSLDKCGIFTLDETGLKGTNPPNGSTATVQDCWK